MRQTGIAALFPEHGDRPPITEIPTFVEIMDNVRLFEEEYHRSGTRPALPIVELNVALLRDWGSVLYPGDHDIIPYLYKRFPSGRVVQYRDMKCRFNFFQDCPLSEDDMKAVVAEIACEIMGWNLYHGSDRGWLICPHVPIRPRVEIDPNTLEPTVRFHTSFGWLDRREFMTDNIALEAAAAAVADPAARRITLDFIESRISATRYFVDGTLTIAVVEHVNGFKAVGTSAAADPKNYNRELGEKAARSRAIEKMWEVEGFGLREEISGG